MNAKELTKGLLTDVRELLSDPERWTQCRNAQDENGLSVPVKSIHAKCFCLFGAIERLADKYGGRRANALSCLERAIMMGDYNSYRGNIIDFNDDSNRLHHEVIKVLDTAIGLVED